jgi:hypothetical protein
MSYLNRTDQDTLDRVPTFIALAQDQITRECKILGVEEYVTGNFTPGVAVVPTPAGWRNTLSAFVGEPVNIIPPPVVPQYNRVPVLLRTLEYARMCYPNQSETGFPRFFSDYSYGQWLFTPTPDQAYPFEICSMNYVQPLSPDYQTNWFTQNAPSVLFDKCMANAYGFLQNAEKQAEWESLYQNDKASLLAEDQLRSTDRYNNGKEN